MKRFAPSPSQVVPGNKLLVNYTGYISHNYFSKQEQYTSIPQVFPGLAKEYLGVARVYHISSHGPMYTWVLLEFTIDIRVGQRIPGYRSRLPYIFA